PARDGLRVRDADARRRSDAHRHRSPRGGVAMEITLISPDGAGQLALGLDDDVRFVAQLADGRGLLCFGSSTTGVAYTISARRGGAPRSVDGREGHAVHRRCTGPRPLIMAASADLLAWLHAEGHAGRDNPAPLYEVARSLGVSERKIQAFKAELVEDGELIG